MPDGPPPNWCACDPGNGFPAEAWFVRARFARGDCPCCGLGCSGPARAPAVVIAEGVTVCAGCAAPGHLRGRQGWAPLLAALVTRVPPPWR